MVAKMGQDIGVQCKHFTVSFCARENAWQLYDVLQSCDSHILNEQLLLTSEI